MALCAALLLAMVTGGCQNPLSDAGSPPATVISDPDIAISDDDTTIVSQSSQPAQIRFGAPRGAAALALTQFFLGDTGEGTFNAIPFSLELAGAPDQLTAKLATGELDAALLPVNLASVLYNKTNGGIQLAAITGSGLFYVVANPWQYIISSQSDTKDPRTITSFSQLDGQQVISFGLGATPQYVIEYLEQYYGVNLDITFTAEAPEAVAYISGEHIEFGILPEPFVTTLVTQNPQIEVVMSLADVWEQATGSPLVTTALVFRTDFITAYPQTTQYLIDAVGSSITWVNEHPADAAVVIADQMILPSVEIADAAIPRTNLIWLTGAAAQTATVEFLTVLANANPAAIGGHLPDDGFFVE